MSVPPFITSQITERLLFDVMVSFIKPSLIRISLPISASLTNSLYEVDIKSLFPITSSTVISIVWQFSSSILGVYRSPMRIIGS